MHSKHLQEKKDLEGKLQQFYVQLRFFFFFAIYFLTLEPIM